MPTKKPAIVKKRNTTRRQFSAVFSTEGSLNFVALVEAIRQVHEQSTSLVNRTVNTALTLRNWIIGAYIAEYEMHDADRAKYGEKLLERLSEHLTGSHVPSCEKRRLYFYRQFFQKYPQIVGTLSPLFPGSSRIVRSVTALSESGASASIVRSPTAQLIIPEEKLLHSLSYTHFEQLIAIDDPLKRAFYEVECIRGNWSVRALKRQIATLYFERSGLSKIAIEGGRAHFRFIDFGGSGYTPTAARV